ncbi:BRO family protein, partial [Pleionea sp. CnH1-48]|uniref:BRO family protein n=1 Tax=Pleionea sp. CnH1-48 TaxID=2954494 RepID=UPI0020976027
MNVIPFEFDNQNIRVIEKEGEPWFVAKDVAEALGYLNTRRAIDMHCKYMILLKSNKTVLLEIPPRGLQIIPERDVYRLIMRSKLPSAERFEDWVVSEVLPSIRKTGGYAIDPHNIDLEQALTIALDATKENKELKHQAQIDAPKVHAYDQLMDCENSLTVSEAAKALGIRPQKDLRDWMFANGWI